MNVNKDYCIDFSIVAFRIHISTANQPNKQKFSKDSHNHIANLTVAFPSKALAVTVQHTPKHTTCVDILVNRDELHVVLPDL